MIKNAFCISFIILTLSGCTDLLLGPTPSLSHTAIFDELWHDFDARYALFEVHHVNWDSLYNLFRPHVTDNMADSVLSKTIDTLLRSLHDPHVGFSTFNSNYNYGEPYLDSAASFDFYKVSSFYLGASASVTGYGHIFYGFINDSLAYIYLPSFDESSDTYGWAAQFDSVLIKLQLAKGLILDVRSNQGGTQANFISIASHFFSASHDVMHIQERNGPKHSDFSSVEVQSISPVGIQYKKPIVLLTDRFTLSAAEWFTLAMKTLPNIVRVGDTTSGAFSPRLDRELANGWIYSLSIEKVTDINGNSFEGRGIPPEVTIHLPPHYRASFSKDTTLDKAIEILSK